MGRSPPQIFLRNRPPQSPVSLRSCFSYFPSFSVFSFSCTTLVSSSFSYSPLLLCLPFFLPLSMIPRFVTTCYTSNNNLRVHTASSNIVIIFHHELARRLQFVLLQSAPTEG